MCLPASNMGLGLHFAFPDVCRTPAMVPAPFPNLSMHVETIAPTASLRVLTLCMPTQVLGTTTFMSHGDEGGIAGGMISQTDMFGDMTRLGSFRVFADGRPMAHLVSLTGQNCPFVSNAPIGAHVIPSQPLVFVTP